MLIIIKQINLEFLIPWYKSKKVSTRTKNQWKSRDHAALDKKLNFQKLRSSNM